MSHVLNVMATPSPENPWDEKMPEIDRSLHTPKNSITHLSSAFLMFSHLHGRLADLVYGELAQ